MDNNPNTEERIATLESRLAECETSAQKYVRELEKLRQQYADDLFAERQLTKQVQEERRQLQHDYAQLRLQKGGFGIKSMFFSGFAGFLSGLLLCVVAWFLRPKDDHVTAFVQFRNAHLFPYELAIRDGKFSEVEKSLNQSAAAPENKLIQPELEFIRKIVGAAKRRCEH